MGVIRSFGLPVVVALNRFPTDTEEELRLAKQGSEEAGAAAAVESSPFTEGGAGCTDLAEALMAATRGVPEEGVAEIDYAYDLSDSLEDKVLAVAGGCITPETCLGARAPAGSCGGSGSWGGTGCRYAWRRRTYRSATDRSGRGGRRTTRLRCATYGLQ